MAKNIAVVSVIAGCLSLPAVRANSVQILINEIKGGDAIPGVYREVGAYCGAPAGLLFAVSWVESRRKINGRMRPWPWTLNVAGQALYFDSRQQMADTLISAISHDTKVDIGLMQINWHWKYARLHSPWLATEPGYNINVACQILSQHYQRSGSWIEAAGRYHREANRAVDRQARRQYQQRVKAVWVHL